MFIPCLLEGELGDMSVRPSIHPKSWNLASTLSGGHVDPWRLFF